MKKVINNEELKKVMLDAVNLLCDTVSSTLGPSGNNVIINNDEISPYITNDGVTIANSIESDDIKINTILDILKEAANKTNQLVGDGTTTTLVLLQSIFKHGLDLINNGKDAIVLKKELIAATKKVVETINKEKRKSNKEDLINVATTSCNDLDLSKLLVEIFIKMENKYAINLEDSANEETYYEIKKGYNIEIDNVSNLYFQQEKEIILKDVNILLLNGYLNDIEQISNVINEGLTNNRNIVVLASDYNDYINQELLVYFLHQNKNIFLFKLPEYASRRDYIIKDIESISGAVARNIDYENVNWLNLGKVNKIIIKQNEITILGDTTKEYMAELLEELNSCNNDYDKEFIANRIAKLNKGIATLFVGGSTKVEIKDKLLRLEDALNAIDIASKGIVVGEGITLLKVSDGLKVNSDGDTILKEVLCEPFNKIMINSGVDNKTMKELIRKSNYQKIINLKNSTLEDNIGIIDPVEVVITALKNASSVAAILLTTNYLVINEKVKNNLSEEKYL